MKKTAVAPSNIAFIKYWGKADDELRLPLNSSFSMNLSDMNTVTTVEFSTSYTKDQVSMVGETLSHHETERIVSNINRLRTLTGVNLFARVMTKNSFPKGTGAAASASGFAALTVAGFAALGLTPSEKERTIFARLCSGSACRSIPDGFVLWEKGNSSDTSYAHSLYPHTYWDLYDLFVIVDSSMKKVSSTEGHFQVTTSPFWKERIASIPEKIEKVKRAFDQKNFPRLGEIVEEDCLSMHRVMQTQMPPLYYWNDTTKILTERVRVWRKEGIPVYFTIDAGPNVHLICEKPAVGALQKKLAEIEEVKTIIVNTSAPGAHLVNQHLF